MKEQIKEGDIVRYPEGLFRLSVRRVYKDDNGDLYVRGCINTESEYKRYIYRSIDGYEWDTSLFREIGFGIARKNEIQLLQD